MYANIIPRRSKSAMIAALPAPPTSARLIARNTLEYTRADGARVVRLHDTDILTFPADGGFTIYTGGFSTVTTRARMNATLPRGWSVYTSRGALYLGTPRGAAFPVLETATVSADGAVVSDLAPGDVDKTRKQIDAYMRAWRERGLPSAEDSRGDPWIVPDVNGKVPDYVVRDWVESKYVHRLLFALACRFTGLDDRGVAIWIADADRRGLDRLALGRIRRYVRVCLGLAS